MGEGNLDRRVRPQRKHGWPWWMAASVCLLGLACALRAAFVARAPKHEADSDGWAVEAVYAQDEPDEPVAYLPLALYSSSHGPYWSGTARFGFGAAAHLAEAYNVTLLQADWYVQYPGFRSDPGPEELEFVQIVRLRSGMWPSQAEVQRYARAHPGTLWLIGNEPDAPAQDCVTPAEYTQLYHQWYYAIKATDPSAKVGIGGVVQATPLRLRYLDLILQQYETRYGSKIPVDVWNVHGFILRERIDSWGCQIPCGLSATQGKLYGIDDHDNMTIFKEQIVRFRQWMKDNGERNKPLIVSEYGILFPIQLGYDPARVEAFMIATFDYFRTATSSSLGYPADGNRLVQTWAWYSLDDKNFEGYESYGHLFDPDTKRITRLGRAYGDYTGSIP